MKSLLADLRAIEEMRRYYGWKRDLISPFLGPRVLEVGCGTGLMLEQFPKRELLLGIDRDPECIRLARARLAARQDIRLECLDLLDDKFPELAGLGFSTVLFINSLEEIGDTALGLQRAFSALEPGGRIAVFAPACPALSGKLDAAFEQRRFRGRELAGLLRAAGFEEVTFKHANMLGILGWAWDSIICSRSAIGPADYRWRDRAVPLARLLDKLTGPPIGLSLLAAGRKPAA